MAYKVPDDVRTAKLPEITFDSDCRLVPGTSASIVGIPAQRDGNWNCEEMRAAISIGVGSQVFGWVEALREIAEKMHQIWHGDGLVKCEYD